MNFIKTVVAGVALSALALTGCGGVEQESLNEQDVNTVKQGICSVPSSATDYCGTNPVVDEWPSSCITISPQFHYYCANPNYTDYCYVYSCDSNSWTTYHYTCAYIRNLKCGS
ncbi:hypothetical protein [Hyalangium minutum]|uniref:Lipoprotein n=1 Tax=Hyalangium minutum TaxID=394096 RepID=A0A085WMT0_9BACT|nr:hypothetical protein [Hyalangium minutum]KFE68993.1 hypothetical protein DB31_6895 [Hyalangium minutum]